MSASVKLKDGYGNPISSTGGALHTTGGGGGGGSGTEYTEDDAAPANPTGGVLLGRRRDTLSTETSGNGDITAANLTGKGEVYVKHADDVNITASSLPLPTGAATSARQDTGNTSLSSIDSKLTNLISLVQTLSPERQMETLVHTQPSITTSSSDCVAANANRSSIRIQNPNAVDVWINLAGATAVVDQCYKLHAGAEYVKDSGAIPTAAIKAISTSGTVSLLVTEGTYV